MSATVTYKGSTLTTAENQTRTLKTAGKYLEGDITITDVTSGGGDHVVVVTDTTDVHGGTIREITATEQNLQTKNVTPSESAQTITADTGYTGLEEVDVAAVSSTYVGSGITRRSSTDLTASGATVTVPAGYYASQASKAVSNGTAGTPTATKGTVSNHSVSVTPSVTNTTGYITGSTKTGTAVTVSASELVSGSETKTENGTYDVTNLAQLVVNVSGGSSKNVQIIQGTSRTNSSSLTYVSGELTVSKTGTYDVYYSAVRTNTSTSYTWGTRLYIDGTAQGTENTTWSNNVQNTHMTSVSLTANQKLRVYARETRGTSYYVCVPMLAIVEN